jgi:hypothetical protein
MELTEAVRSNDIDHVRALLKDPDRSVLPVLFYVIRLIVKERWAIYE